MIRITGGLALLLVVGLTANAQQDKTLLDKVVGIVGDKVVLRSDLEVQQQQYIQESAGADIPENLKCLLMDQMLTQKLFLYQSLVDSIQISEDEVESELDRRIRYFITMIGSKEKLEEYYGKAIVQLKDEFREDIREQLLGQRMQAKVFENVTISPAEVKAFFNRIPQDSLPYFNAEVEVAQIVIKPSVGKEQEGQAKQKLTDISKRIVEGGEDFETLAIIYSEDPGSAAEGGDLGFIERGEMVAEFEAAAFNLKKDEVSQIIKTDFGYHIIQLMERKGDKIHVRHILVRPQVTSDDVVTAIEKLDSVRALIVSGQMTFAQAVEKFSDDENTSGNAGMLLNQQTGTSFFEMDQLDPDTYFTIDTMDTGEISEPVTYKTPTGDPAFRIVLLKSETEPHQANLKQDYHKIQAAALQEKQQVALERWLNKKKHKTYIFVDEDYHGCGVIEKWLNTNQTTVSKYE